MKSTPFLSDRQILNEIVEPFEMMFDSQTADSLIQELASQKRDAFLEAHQECTFKPNANTKFNDSILTTVSFAILTSTSNSFILFSFSDKRLSF